MQKVILPIVLLSLVSGCSIYKEEFDCPVGSGEHCASLGDVNALADQGKYSRDPGPKAIPSSVAPKTRVYYPGTSHQMAG